MEKPPALATLVTFSDAAVQVQSIPAPPSPFLQVPVPLCLPPRLLMQCPMIPARPSNLAIVSPPLYSNLHVPGPLLCRLFWLSDVCFLSWTHTTSCTPRSFFTLTELLAKQSWHGIMRTSQRCSKVLSLIQYGGLFVRPLVE